MVKTDTTTKSMVTFRFELEDAEELCQKIEYLENLFLCTWSVAKEDSDGPIILEVHIEEVL